MSVILAFAVEGLLLVEAKDPACMATCTIICAFAPAGCTQRCIRDTCGCPASGTQVLMWDGAWMDVDDVVPGDKVVDGRNSTTTVLSNDRMDGGAGDFDVINVTLANGEWMLASASHVYITGNREVPAMNLTLGTEVQLYDPREGVTTTSTVFSLTKQKDEVTKFALETESCKFVSGNIYTGMITRTACEGDAASEISSFLAEYPDSAFARALKSMGVNVTQDTCSTEEADKTD